MQIVQRRKIFYIISLLVIIPGLISLFVQGLNLGIDFTGGSVLNIRIDEKVTAGEVRSVLSSFDLGRAEVQKSGADFYIRTRELSQEETKELLKALEGKFGQVRFLSAESVGPVIGKELTRNAVLALLIAGVLMLIYITVRFEFYFGIAAIVGIMHNVLVVLGLFSLFQWEVNSSFIAAILTVIGYSINDTIVVFDRIRENLSFKLKEDLMTLINRSIMQTLNRSINTVLTSAFALIALLAFGGATIKLFVLAMLIGFISGAYSSIFIASPVWYELKARA
ncbi:protein translocase subunit secF [Thermosyntropha lipolytica DSM 11003]|uniref:Protein-export membrane protein SecF n=1 Tax=Thermosyntropha lipolytica DSM 11003 TaxID=1123382 RepID=A0A1M5P900_9FIRM|nr:protein translocase subunit SecF [Thermosyntropha lipolytica]SHG98284.1 protein translocase subunit secF [Thermosyntropha lipolytica DSM 11003]